MKKFGWALRESTLREWSTLQAAPSWTVGLVGCRCLSAFQRFTVYDVSLECVDCWVVYQHDCYGLFVTESNAPLW